MIVKTDMERVVLALEQKAVQSAKEEAARQEALRGDYIEALERLALVARGWASFEAPKNIEHAIARVDAARKKLMGW